MYGNLRVELARKNMTLVELSVETGIRYQTLSEKIRGNSPILLKEAIAIKNALGTNMTLEDLFASEVAV